MSGYKVGYLIGSLAKGSLNRKLAKALVNLAPAELVLTEIPFRDLPLYSQDYDAEFPPPARALKDALAAIEAVLFVTPEFNRSIPGGLKNAIDWLSRYKEVSLKDKPVCIQSAAPGLLGGSRMQYHLRMALQAIDAQLFGKPEVIVNMAANKFADGALKDQAAIDLIKQQLAAFGKFIDRVKV